MTKYSLQKPSPAIPTIPIQLQLLGPHFQIVINSARITSLTLFRIHQIKSRLSKSKDPFQISRKTKQSRNLLPNKITTKSWTTLKTLMSTINISSRNLSNNNKSYLSPPTSPTIPISTITITRLPIDPQRLRRIQIEHLSTG